MAVYRASPNSALRSGAKSRVAFYKSSLQFDTAARAFFAGNTDYPAGYQWESAVGLLLWGARALDLQAILPALHDFWRHFTVVGFITTGLKSFSMRLPTIRRQSRDPSSHAILGVEAA